MVTQDGTVPSVASWFVTLCVCVPGACARVCLCACGVCIPDARTQSFPEFYTHTHRLCRSNSPVPNLFGSSTRQALDWGFRHMPVVIVMFS